MPAQSDLAIMKEFCDALQTGTTDSEGALLTAAIEWNIEGDIATCLRDGKIIRITKLSDASQALRESINFALQAFGG